MDNATILRLWRANVSPNVIVQMIRTANADYDVSANAIIERPTSSAEMAMTRPRPSTVRRDAR